MPRAAVDTARLVAFLSYAPISSQRGITFNNVVHRHFRYHWRTRFWKAGVQLDPQNASLLYHRSNLSGGAVHEQSSCVMSLNAPLLYVIADQTVQVAKAALPKGNRYLLLRDTFRPLFQNPDFAHLFSHCDEQAADARHSRIDRMHKYQLESDDRSARKSRDADQVRDARLSRRCASLGLYGWKTTVYQYSPTRAVRGAPSATQA